MSLPVDPTWWSPAGLVVALSAVALRGRPSARTRRVPSAGRRSSGERRRSNAGSALRIPTERLRRVFTPRRAVEPGDLARWIDDVSRSVGHGRTLRHSLLSVSATVPRIGLITAPLRLALERGATVAHACTRWTERCDAVDAVERRRISTTASILSVTSTVGGSVTQPLDRLAAALRAAAADDLERDAQTAQARISVRVLTSVPFAVLGLLVAFDDDVRDVCATPIGVALVGGGVALNLVGAWWMRRVIVRNGR